MAENLDDGEFWLPPQFLVDDDLAMENKNTGFNLKNDDAGASRALFPCEFPYAYGFGSYELPGSDFSSPVESVVGSSETESDEEEHMTELTRRMAQSTLEPHFSGAEHSFASEKPKGVFVSGSPQSTLSAFGSGCRCRKVSSHGSPNSVCQISSPWATWDLLHAAAGEVERMRLSEEGYAFNHHRGLLGSLRKPSLVTFPVKNSNPEDGFYNREPLCHQQIQMAQMLRQQQMAKQQNSAWGAQTKASGLYHQRQSIQIVPNRVRKGDVVGDRSNTRPVMGLSSSAWPPLQQAKQQQTQQFGSGMRAVFLGNSVGKRECAGTGVFLPRCLDSSSDSRKKPACSTVLVPARVVQALNLKLENMAGGQPQYQPRFNGTPPNMDTDAAQPRFRSNHWPCPQKRNLRPQPPFNQEIELPQEWTY